MIYYDTLLVLSCVVMYCVPIKDLITSNADGRFVSVGWMYGLFASVEHGH